jgi:Rod binding domain-containing protein
MDPILPSTFPVKISTLSGRESTACVAGAEGTGIGSTLQECTAANRPEQIEEAGRQFEALLIAQLLRSAREASGENEGGSVVATLMEVAEQELGKVLASRGGFGLATVIGKGLAGPSDSALQTWRR